MTEKEPSPEDEVLLPDGSESDSVSGVDVNVLALIKNYTNRPDLLIAEIEKWTLLTKVETSCDRILIAGGANVEAEWEQGPAV